jgi:hypothetical protein
MPAQTLSGEAVWKTFERLHKLFKPDAELLHRAMRHISFSCSPKSLYHDGNMYSTPLFHDLPLIRPEVRQEKDRTCRAL